MCQNPTYDHDGNTIWCRKCDRCRRLRINDWVGRCIAEARHATSTHSLTLTYGPDEHGNEDHIHSALLIYRDVQNYFKKLRKAGYKFKYLVAGEYGSKKRRAHWHLLIFWEGQSPEVNLNENFYGHEYWEWGHTFWEKMTPSSVWYVCKYVQKDQGDDEAETRLRMSKKPPIGYEYFQNWAKQHVQQKLPIQTLNYSFSDVTHKDGQRRQYYMKDVTADNFLTAYLLEYIRVNKDLNFPHSEVLQEWIDKKYAKYYDLDNWMKEQDYGKESVEAIKKSQLFIQAKNHHGGVKQYLSGYHPEVEPCVVCNDETVLHYGDTPDETVSNFISVITAK